ncbi:MAG: hypothetical protein ABI134_03210 [Byssovorax sp.]
MDQAKLSRIALALMSAMVAFTIIFWVQSKFDGADRKAALGIVQEYRSKQGSTIPEILDRKHPGAAPSWSVETQSACEQHERVRAVVAGETYDFAVDINRPSIHPGNRAAEGVIAGLDEPRPAGAASGSPSAPASAAPAAPGAP